MDLSINNINLNKKDVSFKGMEGGYDKNTAPVYRFYTPPYDKEKYDIYLEYAPLNKDEKTAMFKPPIKRYVKTKAFDMNGIAEVPQAELDRYSGFGYRFKLVNKKNPNDIRYQIDPFKSIKLDKNGKERMNVIERGNFYGVSPKGGSMRHSFLDSDVIVDGKKLKMDQDFVRNHFNKLGGNIKGLLYLLKSEEGKKELSPYRYFMTTPDIGVDKVSSHRYWPSNQYQCSDLETFKEFNLELFKQGKGYVADGAFTSQGLQSPLVQHVLKWGEKSPFYHWLKIDGRISLGVLPDVSEIDGENPYEHIGVRLVNAKGKNYDKTKPTYIQFYDNRLLSKDKQNNGELIFDYDKAPEDHYDITTHQDSVQPYAFEIDPNDKKLKAFKGQNSILLKDIDDVQNFLIFPNFTIEEKNKVSGTTCWDGNVDIIKMNLSNPNESLANRKGFFDAREYIHGVATYWTSLVQSHLILETAKIKDEESIKELLDNNDISEDRYKEIYTSIQEGGGFVSRITTNPQPTEEIIKAFPLQTLETSDELSAIFAQKEFSEELLDEATLQKIKTIFNTTVEKVIPENFKGDKDYKAYVAKTYGNEILRHIFAGAMKPESIKGGKIDTKKLKEVTLKSFESYVSSSPKEERHQVASKIKKGIDSVNINGLQERMSKELKNISLEDFKRAEALVLQGKGGLNWRFDAAKDIGDLDAVRDGNKTFNEIWNGTDRNPGVQQFWGEFVKRIRQYNPAAYVINEVTTLNEFMPGDGYNDPKVRYDFDPQLANYYDSLPDDGNWLDKKRYENHPLYTKQTQFLDVTNSTTTSEFAKGFNSFSKFAGVDPEGEGDTRNKTLTLAQQASVKSQAGNLGSLKGLMEELSAFNQPNSAIYSHMFVSNHDKPSILHTMPLDMSIFLAKDLNDVYNNADEKTKKQINFLINGKADEKVESFKRVNPKALGVGLAMLKTIDELDENNKYFTSENKKELRKSLIELVNGRKPKGIINSFKRAESFGVKPYEVTIRDLIKNAKIVPEDKLDDATLDFHSTMMKDSMRYFERMWQVMNACIGVPTLYGGSEFAQTGYETPNKNVYLGIRNQVLHNLKDDERYNWYFSKMHKASGLYKTPGLSALRDGTPTSLDMISDAQKIQEEVEKNIKKIAKEYKINDGGLDYFAKQIAANYKGANASIEELAQKLSKLTNKELSALGISEDNDNHNILRKNAVAVAKATKEKAKLTIGTQIWPLYKKESKGSQTISIITNLGLPSGKASYEVKAEENISYSIPSISLKKDGKTLPIEIPQGYILKRIGDPNPKNRYIIQDGEIKQIGGQITLNDTVTTFAIIKEEAEKMLDAKYLAGLYKKAL